MNLIPVAGVHHHLREVREHSNLHYTYYKFKAGRGSRKSMTVAPKPVLWCQKHAALALAMKIKTYKKFTSRSEAAKKVLYLVAGPL